MVGNNFNSYESTGIDPSLAYSALKGEKINAIRFLASKYANEQIRFNCVSPGEIFDYQPNNFVSAYEQMVPIKRMGKHDDIAPAVSFWISDEAK